MPYDAGKVGKQALHWVRWRLGDTKGDAQELIKDDEIRAVLSMHGLAQDSDPITNTKACKLAAADCADAILAQLAKDSSIAITEVGIVRGNAAEHYRKIAADLRADLRRNIRPRWVGPTAYDNTFVMGVDPQPDPDPAE